MSVQFLLISVLILVIALGYITKINTGLYALFFAYLIGSFVMLTKPSAIIELWPLKIFFVLFAVTFFYNFAINNGTLEKLGLNILYKFGRFPALFPFAIYIVGILISGMGAGFYAVVALLCPLTIVLCEKTGMNRLLGVLAVMYGAITGGNFITTATGSVIKEIISSAGFPDRAVTYGMGVFISTFVICLISLVGYYFVLKGYKLTSADIRIEKPEPFNEKQKISLMLVIALMVIVLFPYVLGLFFSSNHAISMLEKFMDVGFVSIFLSIVALLFKVGDQKQALAKVPWNTIIMISGVGVLIALAAKAGTIEMLAGKVGSNGSPLIVSVLITLIAGMMSIFSSTVGVVLPALYPVVKGLAASTGLSAGFLFMIIQLGSIATGVSPFSSGGGLVLGSTMNEETQKYLYPKLLLITFVNLAITLVEVGVMYFIFN